MRCRGVSSIAFVALACAGAFGRPASAMESTKIETKIGDVSFLLHEVCIGADLKTGLIRVVTQMELVPAPYAQTWVAYYTAFGPDEDSAHAFAAIAGIALFFDQQEQLGTLGSAFSLDLTRLAKWSGPVTEAQMLDAVHGALQLFSSAEPGTLREFDALRLQLQLPPGPCKADGTAPGQ